MHSIVLNWNIQEKLVYSYCMKNNKAFTLINSGKAFFFYCCRRFLPSYHQYINNKKDFLKGKAERNVAPLVLSGEELDNVVS